MTGNIIIWGIALFFVYVLVSAFFWTPEQDNQKKVIESEQDTRSLYDLAHDLCDGLDRDYQKTLVALRMAIKYERYTVDELWAINDEDSTRVYDIISNYEHRNRKK